jgi:hypothetical protein
MADQPKEGTGCLVTLSCVIGVVVGSVAGMRDMLPPLLAFLLIPIAAILYALIGRCVSDPFCTFIDWAVGDESSFSEGGIFVATLWPLTPIAAIPLLIYGCIRRMF